MYGGGIDGWLATELLLLINQPTHHGSGFDGSWFSWGVQGLLASFLVLSHG